MRLCPQPHASVEVFTDLQSCYTVSGPGLAETEVIPKEARYNSRIKMCQD